MKNAITYGAILFTWVLNFGCASNTSSPADTNSQNNVKSTAIDTTKPEELVAESKNETVTETKEEVITQDPKKLLADIKKNKVKPLFHGTGTEPFWDLYILEKSVVFDNQSLEEQQYWEAERPFDRGKTSQTVYLVNAKGKKASIQITKEDCDDGMSETPFKYSVSFEGLSGCGELGKK